MASILQSLQRTVILGTLLAILLLIMVTGHYGGFDQLYWASLSRFLHVISGVMWIGLLYYFNFVQIPNMPNIPDEQKPAIGKVIAPAALFWFRWAALATLITGLTTLALYYGHEGSVNALTFTLAYGFNGKELTIGIGMWLAIIMAYNVDGYLANQKKALELLKLMQIQKQNQLEQQCYSQEQTPCFPFLCC